MDQSVKDFNIRLRTIKLRELAVGIIISIILTAVLAIIFPIIWENDDVFFIVILSFILVFYIWALRNSEGLSKNFEELFTPDRRNEILYVFAINIIFECVY